MYAPLGEVIVVPGRYCVSLAASSVAQPLPEVVVTGDVLVGAEAGPLLEQLVTAVFVDHTALPVAVSWTITLPSLRTASWGIAVVADPEA